ncbi:tetratricopeptide repeat protein [Acetobacteraceae bacterium AT-5844]|nr:tetratricopeptide repeat protein [Acetobacteraceae bacterium AT-5844]
MLLGASAAALLGSVVAGGILLWPSATLTEAAEAPTPPPEVRASDTPAAPAPGSTLPLPPEPPRVAEGPEYEACLTLLRTEPEDAIAMAEALEQRGIAVEGARHCMALALLAAGEPERAAPRLERLASSSSAGALARAAIYAQASQAWTMAGEPGRAYAASTLALTLSPEDPALLVDRALAAASLGRYDEALLDLDHALKLEPGRADTLTFRAAALRHLDRQADAMQAIEEALKIAPDTPEALLERGILKQLKGDTAGARRDWQATIASAPDSAAADLARQNLALNEAGPRRR